MVANNRPKNSFPLGEIAKVWQTSCPMSRQLSLQFGDEDRPGEISPQVKGAGVRRGADEEVVAEIAEDLRPRVRACLQQAGDAGESTVEPTSSSEAKSHPAAPPLVRPDRQFTFDGAAHYDWPLPEEDRDTITVDRLRDDIDGPPHRFVIRRGDTVEVFFRQDRVEIGEVFGISHARQEVRVRFGDRGQGIWFAVGQIYPTLELEVESERERHVLISSSTRHATSTPPRCVTNRRQ